jgi:hypothetical protein
MPEIDLQAEIARLQAENDRLKGRSERGITLKVSEKGALSVYGGSISRQTLQGTVASSAQHGR